MSSRGRIVYICQVCHRTGERPLTCHARASRKCDAGMPGDERSKPLFDERGNLVTRAPKWWVDACFKRKRSKVSGKQRQTSR